MTPKELHAQQLLDIRWKRRRWEILTRDGWKCKTCGSNDPCEVHHKYYLPKVTLWDHPDDCLVSLCWSCHNKRHPDKEVRRTTTVAQDRAWEKRRREASRQNVLNQLDQLSKLEAEGRL
jgi:hypothetical protein